MSNKEIGEELNILNTLFEARDEYIATLSEKDIINLKDSEELLAKKEIEFNKVIENIPTATKDKIIKIFCESKDALIERDSYFDKKYYETGFKDAIELIITSIKK